MRGGGQGGVSWVVGILESPWSRSILNCLAILTSVSLQNGFFDSSQRTGAADGTDFLVLQKYEAGYRVVNLHVIFLGKRESPVPVVQQFGSDNPVKLSKERDL